MEIDLSDYIRRINREDRITVTRIKEFIYKLKEKLCICDGNNNCLFCDTINKLSGGELI